MKTIMRLNAMCAMWYPGFDPGITTTKRDINGKIEEMQIKAVD